MRQALRRYIPSMFERRLLLLLAVTAGVALLLLARTAELTLGAMHQRLGTDAERVLWQTTYIPTKRGVIYDRADRPLATDQPGFDVAVSYSVLTGQWAFDRAYTAARREHRSVWLQLDASEREAIVATYQQPYDRQVAQMYAALADLGGISPAELERRRNAVIAQVQETWADVTLRTQQRTQRLNEPISWSEADTPVREQSEKHSLLRDVDERVRSVVEGFIAEAERAAALRSDQTEATDAEQAALANAHAEATSVWWQVEVTHPKHRRYPFETIRDVEIDMSSMPVALRRDETLKLTVSGVGLHIIGLMRDAFAEDAQRRPFSDDDLDGYLDGDRVGKTGVEASMEDVLRGVRGRAVLKRDTGEQKRIKPHEGRDVHLTIDIVLQAQLQALLDERVGLTVVQPYHKSKAALNGEQGKPLNGAAVILDVASSEVLAAASFPAFSLQQLQEHPEQVYSDPLRLPYINRVVAAKYNPGSTIKPVMLVSAVTAGRHDLDETINCTGVLDPDHPDHFRCWLFKQALMQHGPLDAPQALEKSCNIYFFTLGQRMGVARTVDWYGRFGLNRLTDCGLAEEVTGSLPSAADGNIADAINMGIGQGPVAWTPLQAAAAYATVARSGQYIAPTFIKDDDRLTPRRREDLHVNVRAVHEALEGLHDVVTADEGTGRWIDHQAHEEIFDVRGVTIFGKSGTAAPGKRLLDTNLNGKLDPGETLLDEDHTDDHAWFIAIVKPEGKPQPQYVIAVVTEYAGSGARVSGPIVNQIIHLLQRGGWL